MAVEDQASNTSQPTAASRAVAAFLDNLEDEEANQTEGAAKLGVNMVKLSWAGVMDPAEELTEIHSDTKLTHSQHDPAAHKVSKFFADLDGGVVDYEPVGPNHATEKVAAFFEDLNNEENSAGNAKSTNRILSKYPIWNLATGKDDGRKVTTRQTR